MPDLLDKDSLLSTMNSTLSYDLCVFYIQLKSLISLAGTLPMEQGTCGE